MERPTLEGCWVKIARAREHTRTLEDRAEEFVKRRPNQVRFDANTEPPWIIMRACIEPIPIEFSAIAGDTVHNLRSALDYLAWQLVLSENSTPGTHTAFPLYTSESDFDDRVRNPPKGRKGPLAGIDPVGEKWAIIEGVQPYNRVSHDDVLELLSAFSNRDKHRCLLAGLSFLHGVKPEEILDLSKIQVEEICVTFAEPDALEHDAEILRVRASAGTVQMQADLPTEITISEGENAVSIGAFDRMRAEVLTIVRSFERFF